MKQIQLMNKKGEVAAGFGMVGTIMVVILTLAILAIAVFITLSAITTSGVVDQTKRVGQSGEYTFKNETIYLNHTPHAPASVSSLSGVVLSGVTAQNRTAGQLVNSNNYTIVDGTFVVKAGADGSEYNNSWLNISATYTYTVPSDALMLAQNVTTGTTSFFENIPTIFTILGAVLVILAVILIIYAVFKFGSATGVGI